jgi:hypothetical protein
VGAVPFALVGLFCFACRVTTLDVGSDPKPEPDASDARTPVLADAAEADAALTLEQRLRARCAEEPGPSDDYFSGAELTARLVGRWFNCGTPESSPLQDGDADGIVLAADGTWALLAWNATRSDLDATWSTSGQHGMFRYYFFVDSEAGAAADSGITSGDIARDDTKDRTPLVVYLDRAGSPDGFNHTFSKKPRQMTVVESASALRARYVPID